MRHLVKLLFNVLLSNVTLVVVTLVAWRVYQLEQHVGQLQTALARIPFEQEVAVGAAVAAALKKHSAADTVLPPIDPHIVNSEYRFRAGEQRPDEQRHGRKDGQPPKDRGQQHCKDHKNCNDDQQSIKYPTKFADVAEKVLKYVKYNNADDAELPRPKPVPADRRPAYDYKDGQQQLMDKQYCKGRKDCNEQPKQKKSRHADSDEKIDKYGQKMGAKYAKHESNNYKDKDHRTQYNKHHD